MPKPVILLARKQIHKYTNRSCEVFVCSRVFVRNFDLCEIVFFSPECADARIFLTKWPFFYLCICKFLFVAQIKVPAGKSICRTNKISEYTNRALSLYSTVIKLSVEIPPLILLLSPARSCGCSAHHEPPSRWRCSPCLRAVGLAFDVVGLLG